MELVVFTKPAIKFLLEQLVDDTLIRLLQGACRICNDNSTFRARPPRRTECDALYSPP